MNTFKMRKASAILIMGLSAAIEAAYYGNVSRETSEHLSRIIKKEAN